MRFGIFIDRQAAGFRAEKVRREVNTVALTCLTCAGRAGNAICQSASHLNQAPIAVRSDSASRSVHSWTSVSRSASTITRASGSVPE